MSDYEKIITKMNYNGVRFDVVPENAALFTYADKMATYDHFYIRGPEDKEVYWWRIHPGSGEESLMFDDAKQRAIEFGARACLNMSEIDNETPEVYVRQAVTISEKLDPFNPDSWAQEA